MLREEENSKMCAEHVKSKAGRFGITMGSRKPGIIHKGRKLVFPAKGEKSLSGWWKARMERNVIRV